MLESLIHSLSFSVWRLTAFTFLSATDEL